MIKNVNKDKKNENESICTWMSIVLVEKFSISNCLILLNF